MVNQALDALQPVVEALFHPEGVGHSGLRECVGAALAAVNNPHGFDELSTGALYLFQASKEGKGPYSVHPCSFLQLPA